MRRLILGPPERQNGEQEGPRAQTARISFSGLDVTSCRQEFHVNSELVPALFWFGSTDVRKLARQRKCCNFIGIYESGAIPAILRTLRTMYTRTSQERPKQN